MTTTELQQRIITRVSETDNLSLLRQIEDLLDNIVDEDNNHWETLSKTEQNRMIQSVADFRSGKDKGIPHAEVEASVRKRRSL